MSAVPAVSSTAVPWQMLLALEITAFVGVLLLFLDEARQPTLLEDLFGFETLARAVFVGAVLPASLMVAPRLVSRGRRGASETDARLVLVGAVSGLLVGCRSLAALVDTYDYGFMLEQQGLFVAGLSLGLAGLAVFALTIPWGAGLKKIVGSPSNPVAPAAGILAAVVFVWTRYSNEWVQFVFSPASISGPTGLEWVFLAVLVLAGFLRTPYRQPVAFVLGMFSIMSFLANILVTGGPLRPWPNPVTFACCVAMLYPFRDVTSSESVGFPPRG
ncbi:MAG: hypothetical protein ACKOI2_07505 [Actinomycetota bacterium]